MQARQQFTLGLFILALSLVAVGPTLANSIFFTYSDGTNIAHGKVNAVAIAGGQYVATSGSLVVTSGPNIGTYPLYPNPNAPGYADTPHASTGNSSWFRYDNLLYPNSPLLTDDFGLVFGAPGFFVSIWATVPATGLYSFYSTDGNGSFSGLDSGRLTIWNTSNGIDLALKSGVPDNAWWRLVSDAGIDFVVVDAWGGGGVSHQGDLASQQIQAVIDGPGAFFIGAYCTISFNSQATPTQQVASALKNLSGVTWGPGGITAWLAFLAVAVDDNIILYGTESKPQRIWMVKEAVDAVWNAGLRPMLYHNSNAWKTRMDETEAFNFLPLWFANYDANPTLGSTFGKQYYAGPDGNSGVSLGNDDAGFHPVDLDTFSLSVTRLIAGPDPVAPPLRITAAIRHITSPWVVTVTILNQGTTPAYYPRITAATLAGSPTTTAIPVYYDGWIAPGSSRYVDVTFSRTGARGNGPFDLVVDGALLFGKPFHITNKVSPVNRAKNASSARIRARVLIEKAVAFRSKARSDSD